VSPQDEKYANAPENPDAVEKPQPPGSLGQVNQAGKTCRQRAWLWLLLLPVVVAVLLVGKAYQWNPQALYIHWLIRGLGNPNNERAFQVLTQDIGGPAVEPLIEAMNDKNPLIQSRAMYALIAIGQPAVVPLMAHAEFGNGPQSVLIQIGVPAVMPLLAKLKGNTTNPYYYIWYATIDKIGMPAADPLISAAGDVSAGNWSDAMHLLFCYSSRGFDTCTDRDGILVREAPTGDTRTHAVALLTALAGNADPSIRKEALDVLPKLNWMADERLALLTAALRDKDPSKRLEAAADIAPVHDERFIPALLVALKDTDPGVAGHAAAALVGTQAGTNALLATFNTADLANTYRDYEKIIQQGELSSVPILIAVLLSHADTNMAETYLNCGNSDLYYAAYRWADIYRVRFFYFPGSPGTTWGGH
jgi:hypothetical protein